MEKPDFVTEDHLEYLDDLQESGVTNIYGAPTFLEHDFPKLNKEQARQCTIYWMETFSQRDNKKGGKR